MSDSLSAFIGEELRRPVPPAVAAFAASLADGRDVCAVLFYGSILRTGDLSGVLDFYVLTEAPHRRGMRGWVEHRFWPEISFREWNAGGQPLKAKVATMPLGVFAEAASGQRTDTTIWARFVQPAALVWSRSAEDAEHVVAHVCSAVVTAARYALVTGPAKGTAEAFWRSLFAATYRTELRVERSGRSEQIVSFDADRYARLLPLAWQADGIPHTTDGEELAPAVSPARKRALAATWANARRWGRPLNAARLVKAAFVTEGAGQYAAWKVERHTGVALTPWQTRHPILASPLIYWRMRRRR